MSTVSRRAFLGTIGAGVASAALPVAATARPKPNVVIILTDDQGYGDIPINGNDVLDAPNLVSLAFSGCYFQRFYVSPVCAPTRASLLTGRYHLRTGVSGVTHRKETMRASEVTIAEMLRAHGYKTGCFGKWHNGAHYPNHPNGQGFDEFFGFCAGHWNNYFDTTVERNGVPEKTKGYINDVFTDEAISFIKKNQDEPFLCYIPYNTPHSPFQVPDAYYEKYLARVGDEKLASVYGMIENIDDNLGRVLKTLDELDLTNDTIVMFLGDNGPNTERFNGGLRGRKGSTYEGGVRNIFCIRYPAVIPESILRLARGAHIDILPTVAELTGAALPADVKLDGMSLMPAINDEIEPYLERPIFSHWAGRGAVRARGYHLIIERDEVRLYYMKNDRGEQHDIAAENPQKTAELKAAYDAWYADVTKDGLEPPPAHVGHPEMPLVILPAPEAALSGDLAFMGGKGWANDWITNWVNTNDVATWDIHAARQGRYEIALRYCIAAEYVGATMGVDVGGATLEATVDVAHDPRPIHSPDRVERKEVYEKEWARLSLGTVDLPEGDTTLRVRAIAIPKGRAIDLKGVEVRFVE